MVRMATPAPIPALAPVLVAGVVSGVRGLLLPSLGSGVLAVPSVDDVESLVLIAVEEDADVLAVLVLVELDFVVVSESRTDVSFPNTAFPKSSMSNPSPASQHATERAVLSPASSQQYFPSGHFSNIAASLCP